jgi:hypothetical protein
MDNVKKKANKKEPVRLAHHLLLNVLQVARTRNPRLQADLAIAPEGSVLHCSGCSCIAMHPVCSVWVTIVILISPHLKRSQHSAAIDFIDYVVSQTAVTLKLRLREPLVGSRVVWKLHMG